MNRSHPTTPTPQEIQTAERKRATFLGAIPKELLESEDRLPQTLAALNASRRTKLQRIYLLADELAKVRMPYVACGKGCASCCHMNVSLTSAEAEKIGQAIGHTATPIKSAVPRGPDYYAGKPCTFLSSEGACSIYENRPLSCRKHASFFENPTPCHPDAMNEIKVPQVGFSGLDQALFSVSSENGRVVLADIREFFPSNRT